jgi:hypothetical protein
VGPAKRRRIEGTERESNSHSPLLKGIRNGKGGLVLAKRKIEGTERESEIDKKEREREREREGMDRNSGRKMRGRQGERGEVATG